MRQAFVFDHIAVLVGPWHEPGNPPERGTRLELRLLDEEPKRGSPFAAERVVIDQPLFRADLFDQVDGPPGNLRSAHFHPTFDGIEPSDRVWDERVKTDPLGWLADELGDLPRLLKECRADAADADWVDADAAALRTAGPAIQQAVQATWDVVRAS
jgi:hypothetical protein